MKLKKTKKSKKMRGKGMGTHGWGARKKHMGSGHRGGVGMSGSGKKADQKKTLITKKYENSYFGKKGITGKSTKKKINKVMNLNIIEKNIDKFKKTKDGLIDLSEYKILGNDVKVKLDIKAKAVSEKARQAVEKVGGKIILPEKPKKEVKETKSEQKPAEEKEA